MAADLGEMDAKQALSRLGQGAISSPESSTPRVTPAPLLFNGIQINCCPRVSTILAKERDGYSVETG